ncbi:MAG: riboflavin synthase [Deltaproteobacteria bacterium HGW-Deltaproteobacteria-21]|nr:MAG: riboflavin synthase [Deltaproteobacteria bacterium HGW-Deltaproteobacteria-21]
MFTGLIEGKGRVREINRAQGEIRLTILPLFEMIDCRLGESISVNGVCLTVSSLKQGAFTADVSGETLSRSTLGRLKQDEVVNLERALRITDRLGGHLVSGHVDGIGKILKKEQVGGSTRLEIGLEPAVARYTIEKGSIAVDGISLTINRCHEKGFEVNIIPQTAGETNILGKKVGDLVNIETDLIGKYVEKFLLNAKDTKRRRESSTIDMDLLNRHGFGE